MATIPNTQKILTSSADVDTTYGGPDSLKEMNTWYTMQDIIDTVGSGPVSNYKKFVITNLAFGSGEIFSSNIVENDFTALTVTCGGDQFYINCAEFVDTERLYIVCQQTFNASNEPVYPLLEESGSGGYIIFKTPDGSAVEKCNIEVRLYND